MMPFIGTITRALKHKCRERAVAGHELRSSRRDWQPASVERVAVVAFQRPAASACSTVTESDPARVVDQAGAMHQRSAADPAQAYLVAISHAEALLTKTSLAGRAKRSRALGQGGSSRSHRRGHGIEQQLQRPPEAQLVSDRGSKKAFVN